MRVFVCLSNVLDLQETGTEHSTYDDTITSGGEFCTPQLGLNTHLLCDHCQRNLKILLLKGLRLLVVRFGYFRSQVLMVIGISLNPF